MKYDNVRNAVFCAAHYVKRRFKRGVTPEKILIRARLADDVGTAVDIFAAKECRKCFGYSSKGVGRV